MSDPIDGSRNFAIHPRFNESSGDTDVIVQSSDAVVFYLHWKYLQMNPGFVRDIANGSQPNKEKETMILDESSDILEILFQFVYPRRHPTLEDTDFETLLAVAEAVEEYQVFSAMNLCALRLERFLSCEQHATRIFVYATKYKYAKLANQAALSLCRRPDLEVVKHLPPALIIPWLEYRNAWKALFDTQLQKIMESSTFRASCSYYLREEDDICPTCTTSTLAWFQFLENLDKLSDLKSSVIALLDASNLPSQYQLDSFRFGKSNFAKFSGTITGGCINGSPCSSRCKHMLELLKQLNKDIEAIPPFMDFLESD